MIGFLKRQIVIGLERACDLSCHISVHIPFAWYTTTCPLALASAVLDDRWNTQVWKAPDVDFIPFEDLDDYGDTDEL